MKEGGSPEVTRIVEQVSGNLDAIEAKARIQGGLQHSVADTKGRRERIAIVMLRHMLTVPAPKGITPPIPNAIARHAIMWADALIEELDK